MNVDQRYFSMLGWMSPPQTYLNKSL